MHKLGLVRPDEVAAVRAQAQDAMRQAAGQLLEDDPNTAGKRRIRPELWPEPAFVDVGLRGDASELTGGRTLEPVTDPPAGTAGKVVDAVPAVMGRRLMQRQRLGVLGDAVHRPGEGTTGAPTGINPRV